MVRVFRPGDCWTALASEQSIDYATNTGSGTVSLYRINFNGTLNYFFKAPVETPNPTGQGVRDAVLTQSNQFLFTLNYGNGVLRGFWVNRSRAIAPRGTAPIPAGASRLVAL